MLLSPPVYLSARLQSPNSIWELALRYVASTAATLLAVAGAQLVTPNPLIWILTALTLMGLPVSLWLRLNDMRVGSLVIPRPVLNSLVVLLSFCAAFYFVIGPMRDLLLPLLGGEVSQNFWLQFGGGEPVEALMQLFLLFAAFRSFAIISDKDATLTTVPSFSVLLLLIPIHKGIEVVVYFVAWTFVAAILFALDHRSEVRAGVSATVPAVVAGQDVRLGARSLATILGVSLFSAVGVSLWLASRDAEERSATEAAVTSLATRITNLALSLPEVSTNAGPERQIDFTNDPTLPSRAPLWQVRVEDLSFGPIPTLPTYWRMFTLSNYDGVSWKQNETPLSRVPRTLLQRPQWPLPRGMSSGNSGFDSGRFGNGRFDSGRLFFPFVPRYGYDVRKGNPQLWRQTKDSGVLVRQHLTSLVPNLGYLPVLPSVRTVRLEGEQKEIRVRSDGAIDVGIVKINQTLRVLSEVPPIAEYGVSGSSVPIKQFRPAEVVKSGVFLAEKERAINLRLPPTLPSRVRNLSTQMLSQVAPDASNAVKAQRLAYEIQQDAVYTLRPPTVPEGRDATDFFLFDGSRRGYCTYFAGALTVLCRTQGIPARVVSGFGGVQWDGAEAGLLREGNAHAWTEVWVDGFGWTVVDATPPSDRGDNSPTWLESWADWVVSSFTNTVIYVSGHKNWILAAAGAFFALWVFKMARKKSWQSWRREKGTNDEVERQAINRVYRNTARCMARKFRPKSEWETPDEWLQSCASNMSRTDVEALRRLTALYMSARYGSRPLPSGSAQLARESAKSVDWKRVKRA